MSKRGKKKKHKDKHSKKGLHLQLTEEATNSNIDRDVIRQDLLVFLKHPEITEFVRERQPGDYPEGYLTGEYADARYTFVKRMGAKKEQFGRAAMTQEQFDAYRAAQKALGNTMQFHYVDDEED